MRFKVNNKYIVDAKSYDDAIRAINMLDTIKMKEQFGDSIETEHEDERQTEMAIRFAVKEGKNQYGYYEYQGNADVAQVRRVLKRLGYHDKGYNKNPAGMMNRLTFYFADSVKDARTISPWALSRGKRILSEDGDKATVISVKGDRRNGYDVVVKLDDGSRDEWYYEADDVITLTDSINDDWSKGISVTVTVNTDSLLAAAKAGKVRIGSGSDNPEKLMNENNLRFRILNGKPDFGSASWLHLTRNTSQIFFKLYDSDFTYKEFGGKKAFNKAKLTAEMNQFKNDIVAAINNAGIKVVQSKLELGGLDKFESTWRQAQVYNDSVKDAELEADVDLDFLIKDELEAIDGYRKMISKTTNPQLLSILSHILDEETEHVEELRAAQAGVYEVEDD